MNGKIKFQAIIFILCIFLILRSTCVYGQAFTFTLDFEKGDLRGWERTGNAFQYQPTFGDNPTARNRGQPSNHQGNYWIGTYEKYQGLRGQKPGDIQGDKPTGTLTSAPFIIPSGKLSFLVGGGSSFETRVEFLVQDPIEGNIRVFHVSGQNTETMRRFTRDLTPYAGKTGKIRIVDASSGGWGHINVDDFRFTAVQGVTTPVIPAFPLEQKVEVPDLVRRNVSEAEIILDRVKLRLGEITKKPSNQKPGTILRQSPAAHSKVERGTPVNIWVAERELVEVPSLINHHGNEAERILREFGLKSGETIKRTSEYEDGIILQQEPIAGTKVFVGSPVNIWISSKREKPVAKINPEHPKVVQGKRIVFESLSTPEGKLKESWRGPSNQKGTGSTFEVYTDHLNPERYEIVLMVEDDRDQKDKAVAILEVLPPQPIPELPPETPKPQPLPTPKPSEPPPTPKLPWKAIIIGMFMGIGGYYLFSKIKRHKKVIEEVTPEIHIRPCKDVGTQQIESETPVLSGFEICLRPVLDKGKQDIEANGSLIDERREHG
jgi:hypothetical protein